MNNQPQAILPIEIPAFRAEVVEEEDRVP